MVYKSNIAWVGWACCPSPALIMLMCSPIWVAINSAAPDELCRTINISQFIACKFFRVSINDSPLDVAEVLMSRLSTSAERRTAESSKVVRVRVEFSKNKLTMVLPCKIGTFLADWFWTLIKRLVSLSMLSKMSFFKPSRVKKCFSLPLFVNCN